MGPVIEVRSELVANVVGVQVEPGQSVAAGEMVALLESMKMEIPMLAEAGGTVAEVRVAVGDVVQDGDVLVVIEPRA